MSTTPGAGVAEARERLDPVPESARSARETVLDVLARAGRDDLAETASLLVSELVTNAIVHARTPIELEVVAGREGLRVAVHDSSPAMPSQRHYGRAATTGRGLAMVELMSDRHGADHYPGDGKIVWFELGRPRTGAEGVGARPAPDVPASAPGARDASTPGTEAGSAVVPVRLLDVPGALALAWQQHADTLLREYVLSQWDENRPLPAAPSDVGAAHDAFAVVAAAFGAASSEGRMPPVLELAVPARLVDAFGDLELVLEHILRLAEAGYTLAPTTQPEVRSFRHWLVTEVLDQAAGREPRPWPGLSSDLVPAAVPPVEFDPTPVWQASTALLAADDLNRIIAASPAALELLGWDQSLVGKRVVTVIPERLREAHIAAFTLHLLTGEGRIIGRRVEVPALRRDGTEIEITLLIQGETSSDGRAVFVAELAPTGS